MKRRNFLATAAAGSAASTLWTPGIYAEQMAATAAMTEGPFYPDKLPLDTDNDLIIVNDQLTPAVGEITYLSGRVFDAGGGPIAGAHVEIWQCDAGGIYMHEMDRRSGDRDTNFQSYGRFITDRAGRYFFRTIRPVAYGGRTPHIHYVVSKNGQRKLTTQLLIRGEAKNERDGLFQSIAPEQRETVLADFKPAANSTSKPSGDLAQWDVTFDLVLGRTATVRG